MSDQLELIPDQYGMACDKLGTAADDRVVAHIHREYVQTEVDGGYTTDWATLGIESGAKLSSADLWAISSLAIYAAQQLEGGYL